MDITDIVKLFKNKRTVDYILSILKEELKGMDVHVDVEVDEKIHIICTVKTSDACKEEQLQRLKMIVNALQQKHPNIFKVVKVSLVIGQKTLLLTSD